MFNHIFDKNTDFSLRHALFVLCKNDVSKGKQIKKRPSIVLKAVFGVILKIGYTIPCATIAFASFVKAAMFAPAT